MGGTLLTADEIAGLGKPMMGMCVTGDAPCHFAQVKDLHATQTLDTAPRPGIAPKTGFH